MSVNDLARHYHSATCNTYVATAAPIVVSAKADADEVHRQRRCFDIVSNRIGGFKCLSSTVRPAPEEHNRVYVRELTACSYHRLITKLLTIHIVFDP